MQHICKICNQKLKNAQSLSAHCRTKHKMTSEDVYIEYFLNGVRPTCTCGCGETPNYLGIYKGFVKYIQGHASRINNNWGHNTEALRKSHETQKKMYESGELVVWNKGLTKENDDRVKKYGITISKYVKTEEHKRKIIETQRKNWVEKYDELVVKTSKKSKEYWSKPENRDLKRVEQTSYLKERLSTNKSKLEQQFENIMRVVGIEFLNQFPLDGYLFDFYVPKHNILIEVDGDWFHCNPNVHPEPIYETQKVTLQNDERKNKVVKDNNITLLRFWEKDINESPEKIKLELSKYL